MKYHVKNHSVYCDKIEIARVYIGEKSSEVRVLQGVPRTKVIQKIINDCPEFAQKNELHGNYWPKLFSR